MPANFQPNSVKKCMPVGAPPTPRSSITSDLRDGWTSMIMTTVDG
jgi:hypothetical protein